MPNTKNTKNSVDKPTMIGKGRYAIFETPEGNGVISYRPDGENQDQHQVIPSGIWQFLMKAMRGEAVDLNPMTIMKLLVGGK